MSLTPINVEQVQQSAQVALAFLSDGSVSVPANMLEGIVSSKSLLRGIISGQLIVCHQAVDQVQPAAGDKKEAPDKDPEKTSEKEEA